MVLTSRVGTEINSNSLVDSKLFLPPSIMFTITVFLDLVRRPAFQEIEDTTFPKFDLFLSLENWREIPRYLHCWIP
jgi:hypothetical protein